MASYLASTLFRYTNGGSGTNYTLEPPTLPADDTDFTYNDGESDTTWEAGDGVLGSEVIYIGKINVSLVAGGSIELPVLQSLFFGFEDEAYILIPDGLERSDLTAPPSFNSATIDDSNFTTCFLAGTLITTPNGTSVVEDLSIGDMITTAGGKTVPVKWIGKQTVFTAFGPAERVTPVRVKAHALGNTLPERDLTLTADHALLIDGHLINAGALVNGTTIDWVPLSEFDGQYTVYHIETEAHDIVLAEGAPAETFIDYVGRQAFDNYDEYQQLYGDQDSIHEMPYPRISSARLVPASVVARLNGKVAA